MSTPTLQPASLPLALEECDATSLRELLEERGGQPLTIDDAKELIGAMVQLRDAYEDREPEGDPSGLLFRAVAVGGQVLHSATIASRIAMRRIEAMPIPADWQDEEQEWHILCQAYCLAHSREPAALESLSNPLQAKLLVEEFAAGLACQSIREVLDAVNDLLTVGYPPPATDTALGKARRDPITQTSCSGSRSAASEVTRPGFCTKSLKAICTGCAGRLRRVLAVARRSCTRRGPTPTTHASPPPPAGARPSTD